jgi:hypothetical protein
MAIRAVFRPEFDRILPTQSMLNDFSSKAVEWFADDAGNVLGVIAHHKPTPNWSIVVLGRGHQAHFRALHLDFGFRNCDDARRLLFEKMEATITSQNIVHTPSPSAA